MGQLKQEVGNKIVSEDYVKDCDTKEINKSVKTHKCSHSGCSASFARPSKLVRHIRLHTGERPYKCNKPGCEKTYTNSSHLKRHMQVHNSVKEVYRCVICSLTISNAGNLKRHIIRAHSDDKISCSECNMTFNKKYQLARHLYTHSNSELHKCDKCNMSYTNLTKLERHKKSHAGTDRTYTCDVSNCSEVFQKWAQLCAHKKTKHVRDYTCTVCNKSFLSKSHLKHHSMVHSEDRPVFSCPYDKCHRSYFFKRNLAQHIRSTHMGEKFYCDICSVGLCTKQKLIEHIEQLHNPEKKKRKPQPRKTQRKKRKDAGTIKKSAVSSLIGLLLPIEMEKALLQREVPSLY